MMRNLGRGHPNNIYNNNQKFEKRNLTLARINEERFAYAMSCLVGKDVIVGMDNGRLMKGSFHSFDPSSRTSSKAVDIALQNARFVSSEKDEGHTGRPFVIYGNEYNYVVTHSPKMGGGNRASKAHPPSEKPAPPSREPATATATTTTTKRPPVPKFKTDTEISASKSGRQSDKLTEWKPDGPVDESQLYELDAKGNTQWDQFESNRKAFGVKSTYNENLYTTELKLDEVPREMKEHASKLAAEIMGRNGESSYSHLERYLEQDEDNMYNPTAEIVVKKALAKSTKASKKDEKHDPVVKTKSRPSEAGAASTAHNQRQPTANHSTSHKEVPDSGRGNTSTPSSTAKQPADPTTKDWRSQGVTGAASERDKSHHQQSHGGKSSNAEATTSVPPVGRPEVQAVPSKSEAHASTPATGEAKKGERGGTLAPSHKGEEKSTTRIAGGDVKPIAPSPPASSTGTKKSSFTFNPNASTFTPTSVVDPNVKAATGVQSGPTVAKASGSTPQTAAATANKTSGADSSKKSAAATATTTTTANEKIEFKAFNPMDEYPRLDVSSYTSGEWLVQDEDFDVKWPDCSKASYRAIMGDLALLQLTQTMAGLRPQQPILPTPGMATVLIPHHGSVAYPGYHQFGGFPLGMFPYNRQMTPKFYNSPKQKHPPVQIQYVAARRSAAIVGPQPQLQTVGAVQVAVSGKAKTPSENKPDAQT